MSFSPRLDRMLAARIVAAQRDWRAPGLSVSIVRGDEPIHTWHVGTARLDPAAALADDTRFMIGSITKTFTAVLIMSLRDEGRLSLDDTLATWLPQSRHAAITVRSLLAHSSGLQREPIGRIWENLVAPGREQMLAELEQADQVLPVHHAFHYSNLAYALLGEIVCQVTGRPWLEVLQERILDPLGMARTTLDPGEDRARGYLVDPWSGVATEEPLFDLAATAPLGGLWSSVADMARYASFIADPEATGILSEATLAEMCRPLIMTDPDRWSGAYGLGFGMLRLGDRVHIGHGGAMPGFLSGLRVRRPERIGAFVVATATSGAASALLAAELIEQVLDEEPNVVSAWTPETPRPEFAALLGPWYSEGEVLTFTVREGQLWAHAGAGSDPLLDTRFERIDEQTFRAVEGRERGELLELVNDEAGALDRMYFATYAVTRTPAAFADLAGHPSTD